MNVVLCVCISEKSKPSNNQMRTSMFLPFRDAFVQCHYKQFASQIQCNTKRNWWYNAIPFWHPISYFPSCLWREGVLWNLGLTNILVDITFESIHDNTRKEMNFGWKYVFLIFLHICWNRTVNIIWHLTGSIPHQSLLLWLFLLLDVDSRLLICLFLLSPKTLLQREKVN